VVERHDFRPHFCTHDVQISGSAKSSAVALPQSQLSVFIDVVAGCIRCNRLQLNTAKTDITWCSTSRWQRHQPTIIVRAAMIS
jgi:hypothetical protein